MGQVPGSAGRGGVHQAALQGGQWWQVQLTQHVTKLLQQWSTFFIVSDTLMTLGSTCPRMATPPCLRTYCWRTPRSLSGWAWTTSSEERNWWLAWELKSIHRIVDSLPEHDLLIFTGPIDAYFAMKGLPKLEYRSVTLRLKTMRLFNWVISYLSNNNLEAFIGRKNTWSQQQNSSSQPG